VDDHSSRSSARKASAACSLRAARDCGAGGGGDEGVPEDLGGVESFDVSEERGELKDFGDGRVGSLNRLIYTSKETGEVAAVKPARLVYTVRDGKIVRYELENVDEFDVAGAPGH
jgi:hypothetical protein